MRPLLCLIALGLGSPSLAQDRAERRVDASTTPIAPGKLVGTVTDATTGEPVAQAVLTLIQLGRQERVTQTSPDGTYSFEDIEGVLTVRLEAEGYRPYSRGGVVARAGDTVRVSVQLLPDNISGVDLVISCGPSAVDVGSASTGVSVGADFVQRVPLFAP